MVHNKTILKEIESIIRESKEAKKEIDTRYIKLIEEKIVSWVPIPPMLVWLSIGTLMTITVIWGAWFQKGTVKFWLFTALIGFLLSHMGWLIFHFKNEMISLFPYLSRFINIEKDKLREWYIKEIAEIFKERYWMLFLIPLLMLANALWVSKWYTYEEAWFGSVIADSAFSIMCFCWFFVVIHHFQYAVRSAIMLNRLSHLPFDTSILFNSRESVKKIGNTFFYFAFHAVICFTIFGFAISLSPLNFNFSIILWILFALIAVLIVLLIPQYNIHKVMVQVKQKYINAITPLLKDAYERVVAKPNKDNIEKLGELEGIFEHLKKTPEWPFDSRAAFSLLSAIIVPSILSLVKKLLD